MHTETLGSPGPSDCLERAKEIQGEMMLIFGLHDTHVDEPGRTKIRARLNEVGVQTSFLELVSPSSRLPLTPVSLEFSSADDVLLPACCSVNRRLSHTPEKETVANDGRQRFHSRRSFERPLQRFSHARLP